MKNNNMENKIVLVTGATHGIGKEIARGLANQGAILILGARNLPKAQAVCEEIRSETNNQNVSPLLLDVADQSSLRDFAKAFRARHDRLDVLINNAGAWFNHREESPDGIELTWATNVLGPYLLVRELQEPLRKAAPSRILNMASDLANNYDPTDVEFRRRKYDGFKAYGQSKLAIRKLTWWQAKKFEGTGVTANAVAPGFVQTGFMQDKKGFVATMIRLVAPFAAVTPEKGAETPIWVASAPELALATAKYYESRKEKEGKFREGLDEFAALCEKMTSKI